jgi:hypothetical protein
MQAMNWKRLLTFGLSALGCIAHAGNVTTHHYDTLRTGWNKAETVLTPAAVSSASFQLSTTVPLDEQVDAQPLLLQAQAIPGQGTHDVVYVATEGDTVYGIDAASGAILMSRSLGTPVPYTALPGACGNNSDVVGINSTPVIDSTTGTLYVIAYTYESGQPVFRIHALSVTTLADKVTPVVVTASASLTNGDTYTFQPGSSRQRSALLLANRTVYAGFASFCDNNANNSRGWVLGWSTGTLAPLPANTLTNQIGTTPDQFYLSSVWMAGSGLAASRAGNIYFVTGNTDYNGTEYNPVTNIAESAVEISSDLLTVESLFTPSDQASLDQEDNDFGSGGILLLPAQAGASTEFATAAGKDGYLYLLNAENLGSGKSGALDRVNIGGCWCSESYFTASNGTGRVVASGGNSLTVWEVRTGAKPRLVHLATSGLIANGQDPGSFTTVSSNGTTSGSVVLWTVGRPTNSSPASINLYAFSESGQQLFSGVAGTWPNTGGDADLVPVVANGRVYVASYQSLAIYGLGAGAGVKAPLIAAKTPVRVPLAKDHHEVFGTVVHQEGAELTVAKRNGDLIAVDGTEAFALSRAAQPSVGHGIIVRGTYGASGVLEADTLLHAKDNPALWPADR